MPVRGPNPKPRNQIRHRVPPVHEWTDVLDEPFLGAPPLPRTPNGRRRQPVEVPEPPRPLGAPGSQLWHRAWSERYVKPDIESLLVLCEEMDERVALRVRVLKDGDWHERQALRTLDAQITAGLRHLGLDDVNRHPTSWPTATKRWWKAVSQMPHCVNWSEPEWQFAFDTAQIVAAFHMGDLRLAGEIRGRERLLGTTPDARRGLRIRYVDAVSGDEVPPEASASITAMDDYRRMVGDA